MSISKKNTIIRKHWLLYFNRVLYEKGIITPPEYYKMKHKICSSTNKHSPTASTRNKKYI